MKISSWLEPELERGLRNVTAPPDLWDRVQAARAATTHPRPITPPRLLTWAMAATVTVMAIGVSVVERRNVVSAGEPQRFADHCENPAELRAYARANPGLEVVSRSAPAPLRVSVQQNSLACNLCHLD